MRKLRSQEEVEKALENISKEIKTESNKCIHISHPFDKDRKRFLIHVMVKVKETLKWALGNPSEFDRIFAGKGEINDTSK